MLRHTAYNPVARQVFLTIDQLKLALAARAAKTVILPASQLEHLDDPGVNTMPSGVCSGQ